MKEDAGSLGRAAALETRQPLILCARTTEKRCGWLAAFALHTAAVCMVRRNEVDVNMASVHMRRLSHPV